MKAKEQFLMETIGQMSRTEYPVRQISSQLWTIDTPTEAKREALIRLLIQQKVFSLRANTQKHLQNLIELFGVRAALTQAGKELSVCSAANKLKIDLEQTARNSRAGVDQHPAGWLELVAGQLRTLRVTGEGNGALVFTQAKPGQPPKAVTVASFREDDKMRVGIETQPESHPQELLLIWRLISERAKEINDQ